MQPRAWIVGENEAPILGDGWYDRCPDWFGIPFRESFPEACLSIENPRQPCSAVLLLSSALAFHQGKQTVSVECEGSPIGSWELPQPAAGSEWQAVAMMLPRVDGPSRLNIGIRAAPWRHGDYEPVDDYRPVGFLFAGLCLAEAPAPGGQSFFKTLLSVVRSRARS